jgi:hypothetical protein
LRNSWPGRIACRIPALPRRRMDCVFGEWIIKTERKYGNV